MKPIELSNQIIYETNVKSIILCAREHFHSIIFKNEVLSTSYLAAAYVKNVLKLPEDKKVYMIGMPGLVHEFDLLGIKTVGPGVRNYSFTLFLPSIILLFITFSLFSFMYYNKACLSVICVNSFFFQAPGETSKNDGRQRTRCKVGFDYVCVTVLL